MIQARTERGQIARTAVIVGRKNCSKCGLWRLLIYYSPQVWNTDGTIRYTHSRCSHCRKVDQRGYYDRMAPSTKRRRVNSSRAARRRQRRQEGRPEHGARVVAHHQRGSVRREPFAAWLLDRINETNVTYVANRTGLPDRRIRAIIDGYDTSGLNLNTGRKGKLRAVDHIELDTVDRALTKWGESPGLLNEMYPPSESS